MLSTWWPSGAIDGSAIDGTLTSMPGRSSTPPSASIAAARSISAIVGAIVSVDDNRCSLSRRRGSVVSTTSSLDS